MVEDEEPGFRAAVKPQTCGHSADTKVQGFRCGLHSHPNYLIGFYNLVGAQGLEPWTR